MFWNPNYNQHPKSELGQFKLENPEPNTVYGYKSIWTDGVQFKWPKSCLKSSLPSYADFGVVWITVVRYSDFHSMYLGLQNT